LKTIRQKNEIAETNHIRKLYFLGVPEAKNITKTRLAIITRVLKVDWHNRTRAIKARIIMMLWNFFLLLVLEIDIKFDTYNIVANFNASEGWNPNPPKLNHLVAPYSVLLKAGMKTNHMAIYAKTNRWKLYFLTNDKGIL
jgi:hypothetical protein